MEIVHEQKFCLLLYKWASPTAEHSAPESSTLKMFFFYLSHFKTLFILYLQPWLGTRCDSSGVHRRCWSVLAWNRTVCRIWNTLVLRAGFFYVTCSNLLDVAFEDELRVHDDHHDEQPVCGSIVVQGECTENYEVQTQNGGFVASFFTGSLAACRSRFLIFLFLRTCLQDCVTLPVGQCW